MDFSNVEIIKAFANTLAEIDTAIVIKSHFTYNDFVNNIDGLLCIALEGGDIVPDYYIDIIDQALTELGSEYKGKYLTDYLCAVSIFKENRDCDIAADYVCSPEYLGRTAEEEAFYFEDVSEDYYERIMAYGRYSFRTEPEEITPEEWDVYQDAELCDGIAPCRFYKRSKYNAYYLCDEASDYIGVWHVEAGNEYYSFLDYKNLTDIDLIVKMEKHLYSNFIEDPIGIVKESEWRIQEDHSERKDLIGSSETGYLFGYIEGNPTSEPNWQGSGFETITAAEEARDVYEREEENRILNDLLVAEAEEKKLKPLIPKGACPLEYCQF